MSEIIEPLRTDFLEIVCIYSELIEKRDKVAEKVVGLKERYNELIKQNTQPMFLFCLESLFFQYKILNLEMENYQKSASLIQNRIYGDYYKLYNMMLIQCKENNLDVVNSSELCSPLDVSGNEGHRQASFEVPNNTLPVYKDIDPFFKYRIEDIITVHDKILEIIGIMDKLSIKKTENIQHHRENVVVGFSLRIFIQTLEYEHILIKGQIQLFMDYIQFYHSSQRTYLEKLVKKIVDFTAELEDFILIPNHELPTNNSTRVETPSGSLTGLRPSLLVMDQDQNIICNNEFSEEAYEESNDSQPNNSGLRPSLLDVRRTSDLVLGPLLNITVPDESVCVEPDEPQMMDETIIESAIMVSERSSQQLTSKDEVRRSLEEFTNMIVDESNFEDTLVRGPSSISGPPELEYQEDCIPPSQEDGDTNDSVVVEENNNTENNSGSPDSLPDPDNNEDGSYEEASQ